MEREEDKIKRLSQMLENASNILRGTESTKNSQMHQTSGFNTHAVSSNTTQVSSSNERRALDHARNMIRSSTASGTYRRLNRSERLRATALFNNRNKTQAKPVARKKKALEFALLKCFGGKNFRTGPYFIMHAFLIINICGLLFFETMHIPKSTEYIHQ